MSECIPVAVIEDDKLIRTTMECSLKLCGFQISSAKDDLTGLQLAKEKQQAFILPDWTLAEMDRSFETGPDDYIIKFQDLKSSGKTRSKSRESRIKSDGDTKQNNLHTILKETEKWK